MAQRGVGTGSVVRFGVYELNSETGELRKSGIPLHLPPQPARLLTLLVGRPGELITRDEIREQIWGSETHVDFEQGLNQCIKQIRAVLHDDAATARYIQTVTRRGYRFIAPVISAGLDSGAMPRRQEPVGRSRIWIAGAVTATVLLAGGLFTWHSRRASQGDQQIRAFALTTLRGYVNYPSFSPEGNHVAFTWNGPQENNTDIYVQQIGAGSPLRLTTDSRREYNPVWSPDGRWIAFLRNQPDEGGESELRLVPPFGGPERRLARIRVPHFFEGAHYVDWCPDSTCLVVTDSPGKETPEALFVVSLESGGKRQLTNPRQPVLGDTGAAVSPDGRSLVFRRNLAPFSGELHWLKLEKGMTAVGEPRRLTLAALDAETPAWLPDGKDILFSAKGCLWRLPVRDEGSPARLPFVGEDGRMPVASRPRPGQSSRLAYVRGFDDENVWRIETSAPGAPSSKQPVVAISSTRSDNTARFSPDGRRVAFESNRSGTSEVWLADPDGANAVQLTSMGADAGGPSWSPDGQMIAFDSNVEGQFEIYLVSTEGGQPRRITSHPANDNMPSFSRDGRWIYFRSDRNGKRQIWKVPVSGGEAVLVTQDVAITGFESPDGSHVYYMGGPTSLWRVPSSGGTAVKVLDGVVERAFVVLKTGIYYVDRPLREARLQFFDFATGRSTLIAHNLGALRRDRGLSATADGRTILYTRVDSHVSDLMLVDNFH